MKKLLFLALLAAAGFLGYHYYTTGENPLQALKSAEGLPTRDAQGRELVPCSRCLATGLITCQASRCKEGQVPCPGRCLKLSDHGWKPMEGQDPNKLFMMWRVDGGWDGRSQEHVGEVFEVRLGKFYDLGVCKICQKQTTVPCQTCQGSGKATCTVCTGQKVVVKAAPSPAPKPAAGS